MKFIVFNISIPVSEVISVNLRSANNRPNCSEKTHRTDGDDAAVGTTDKRMLLLISNGNSPGHKSARKLLNGHCHKYEPNVYKHFVNSLSPLMSHVSDFKVIDRIANSECMPLVMGN
ncbi:hypothetical protein AVEN_113333-1 [Araneus ventricosus]|uniref:Uncharacterized protein n=1 Tax=Araneus ventricosus TaxID=182803 RepID=A0A4Y2H9G5_ARAVE|nr:hypothetical protein AVEN_113333-1 [Araneus ventricosus]